MTTFALKVESVHTVDHADLIGVVSSVDFSVTGTQSGQSFALAQTVDLPEPNAATFVPLHQLAEHDVLAWVEALCPDAINATKERLQQLLDQAAQRPAQLPWVRVSPEEALAAKAGQVRAERNNRLADSDWTQVADAPVDKAAWAAYRQALRDITAQAGFPVDVQWPAQPA